MKVSHVSNGTRLWVAVLQHFPKYKGEPLVETHNPSVLMEMTLSLSQFYSENPDTHLNGMLVLLENFGEIVVPSGRVCVLSTTLLLTTGSYGPRALNCMKEFTIRV